MVKLSDLASIKGSRNKEVVYTIQDVLDDFMTEYGTDDSICKNEFVSKLPVYLLESLVKVTAVHVLHS